MGEPMHRINCATKGKHGNACGQSQGPGRAVDRHHTTSILDQICDIRCFEKKDALGNTECQGVVIGLFAPVDQSVVERMSLDHQLAVLRRRGRERGEDPGESWLHAVEIRMRAQLII